MFHFEDCHFDSSVLRRHLNASVMPNAGNTNQTARKPPGISVLFLTVVRTRPRSCSMLVDSIRDRNATLFRFGFPARQGSVLVGVKGVKHFVVATWRLDACNFPIAVLVDAIEDV